MKRILTIMALTVALSASAQIHKSQSFLNAQAIYFSNVVTFPTNLTSTISPGTNISTVIWTNKSGMRVAATNTARQAENLLGKAQLWTDRNALPTTGTIATNSMVYVRFGNIGANATNAVTFVFVPVPNGVNPLTTNKFIFTTPLTVKLTPGYMFGFNLAQWPGCKEVMLESVSSVDTTSAGSDWYLLECSLNGFMP